MTPRIRGCRQPRRGPRSRAAAARRLLDYAIWRPGAPDGVGDIHRGRVTARGAAMAGEFLALNGAEGFLPDSEGGRVCVRAIRLGARHAAAQGGKGPRLTARL